MSRDSMARTQDVVPQDLGRLLAVGIDTITKSIHIHVPGRPEESA
jgi:hypothetical protein